MTLLVWPLTHQLKRKHKHKQHRSSLRPEAQPSSMPPRNDAGGSNLPRSASASAAYSIYPTDSVQDTAEALGLPPLRDGVASALAADVEYRLRQLVQDASKFMRHGKRSQLRVCDVDRALRQRNVDPIFGFHPTTLGKASASGHYPTPVGSTFRRIQTQSGPIHLVADEEIDLEKALEGGPQVALGPGVGWSAHWLAVEGVQPAVPQNPVPGYSGTVGVASGTATPSNVLATAGNSMVQPGGTSAFLAQPGAGRPGQAVAKPLIKHVLSRELQLYFERLTNAIVNPPSEADVNESGEGANSANKHASGDGDTSMADGLDAAAAREPNGQPVLKRSEREKAKTSGNIVRDAALASLRGDPGLHQLVPYLIQWVGERIQHGLRDEVVLDQMLYTIEALVFNPYLGIEPYVSTCGIISHEETHATNSSSLSSIIYAASPTSTFCALHFAHGVAGTVGSLNEAVCSTCAGRRGSRLDRLAVQCHIPHSQATYCADDDWRARRWLCEGSTCCSWRTRHAR